MDALVIKTHPSSFPAMDALIENMDQHEVLLEKVEEELRITESRLDKAFARESLTQFAMAR